MENDNISVLEKAIPGVDTVKASTEPSYFRIELLKGDRRIKVILIPMVCVNYIEIMYEGQIEAEISTKQ